MYNRKVVFVASCLAMLVFGIVMTVLGSTLPSIIVKFNIDKINAGSLPLLLTFGILLGSIVFGPIVDRFGYKGLLIVAIFFILFGLIGIAVTRSFTLLRVFVFIIGLGGGVINGSSNALVADISEKDRSAGLSLLGVFFCISAFGVPFLLGNLLSRFSYENILLGVSLSVVIPLLFFIIPRFPAPKHVQGFPLKEGIGLLKELPLMLFGFILFFESGMEISVGSWASSFFKEELGADVNKAVVYFSFYWLGMMAARLVLNNLLKKFAPANILRVFIGITFVGTLLMIFTHNLPLAIFGVILVGIGLAAAFPIILGFVGDRYSQLSGTAFSISFVLALLGGMSMPYLIGLISNSYGLRVSFFIIPISLICQLLLLTVVLRRIAKR